MVCEVSSTKAINPLVFVPMIYLWRGKTGQAECVCVPNSSYSTVRDDRDHTDGFLNSRRQYKSNNRLALLIRLSVPQVDTNSFV